MLRLHVITGHSLGRVIGQFEWIETVVQSARLTAELLIDDQRPTRLRGRDLEASQISTTRRTLGASVMKHEKAACLYS